MVKAVLSPILQMIRRAVDDRRVAELPEQELLQRFHAQQDGAAFHALLCRHGPMVLDVCRGVLGNDADVEDAFQATFLILARKTGSIRKTASLASWLHGVAYRTALKARAQFATRQKHEARAPVRQASEPDDLSWREVRQVLHDELSRLPERCRAPLVLCYLEGATQEEAAVQLGLAKSTLRERLERGRVLLRARLMRRGLGPAAVLVASMWPEATASAGVPRAMLDSTIKAASLVAAGKTAAAGLISAKVTALTEGVLRGMLLTKLKMATAALLLGFLAVGVATSGLIYSTQAAQQAESPKEVQPKGPGEANKEERGAVGKKGDPVGIEQPDERQLTRVSAPTDGRVEKIYKATGERVKKGETLAELYSPDLMVTTQELLDARRKGNADLQRIFRDRFRLWGIDDDQMDQILKTGKAVNRLTVRSPVDGKVIRTYGIRGAYVKLGDPLYDVADLSTANAKETQPTEGVAVDGKVYDLLKERLATLKAFAKATETAYNTGKATFAEVAQANTLVFKAELELCQSDKERLGVHEKLLASARANEKATEELYKAGRARQLDALGATASRLEAEIAFERAKTKVAPPSK